jgi:NAD(P)-dependent dehydrogenase (short-subunit alcohol dehydrogenase family)
MVDSAVEVMGLVVWFIIGCYIVTRVCLALLRRKKLDVQDRWVVVTGCDTGIGAGAMNKLIEDKASVIAFCYTDEGSKAALAAGAKLAPRLDIADSEAVKKACEQVKEACGENLWGLAHIAGSVYPGFIEYQNMENYKKTMDVNFYAIVDITQHLISSLRAATGRVVIVTSVDGIVSLPGNAPYDAAKFAAEAYADAFRVEMSYWDIGVSVINPSTLRTPLAMNFFEAGAATWDQMDKVDPNGDWKQYWTREWLEGYAENMRENLEMIAQDPNIASSDIHHALTAARPKARYLSGRLARTLFYALWIMPEHWAFVIKKGTVSPAPNIELPDKRNS